jgi:hypothetical protein
MLDNNKKTKVLVVSKVFLVTLPDLFNSLRRLFHWQSTVDLHLFVLLQGIHDLNEKYRHLLPFLGKHSLQLVPLSL